MERLEWENGCRGAASARAESGGSGEGTVASPVVSVIVPSHNRADLLPRAIASVLRQTFQQVEVIIVDDGSTDDTRRVVTEIDDPRLRFVWQANAGAATARNTGVAHSVGRYVTFLDSDDEVAPDWLETLVDGFRNHDADIVCCGLVKDWSLVERDRPETVTLPGALGPLLDGQIGLFMGGTFALKREIFDQIGGYVPGLPSGQHTELSFRLVPEIRVRGWRVHSAMKPLVRVHVHPGARVRSDWAAVLEGTDYLLTVHSSRYDRNPRSKADACGVAGVASVRVDDFARARRYLWAAVRAQPKSAITWARFLLSLVPPIARRVWNRGHDAA